LSYAEIGARLGLTKQGAAYLLAKAGAAGPLAGAVRCQGCGAEVARGRPGFRRQAVLCPGCLGPRGATFGQRLRACRLAAGLSQGELAGRSGIARTAVQNYEQGRWSPRPAPLARLVRVLGPGLAGGPPQ
jgi:DNA-binding XRE family transcriptional regulator